VGSSESTRKVDAPKRIFPAEFRVLALVIHPAIVHGIILMIADRTNANE
jgi:hypothetical protein